MRKLVLQPLMSNWFLKMINTLVNGNIWRHVMETYGYNLWLLDMDTYHIFKSWGGILEVKTNSHVSPVGRIDTTKYYQIQDIH